MSVRINGPLDAIVWDAVDSVFSSEATPRQAAEAIELGYLRSRARYFLTPDWILDVLRATDPAKIDGGGVHRAA